LPASFELADAGQRCEVSGPALISVSLRYGVAASGSVNGMVQGHQTLDEAAEEIVFRLCDLIDMYVAIQRNTLARFPECGRAGAVSLGAQLDQLEATAREGARALR
jgi:hypothetical protein